MHTKIKKLIDTWIEREKVDPEKWRADRQADRQADRYRKIERGDKRRELDRETERLRASATVRSISF